MDLYEEIRGNAGVSDIEYLEEGIVFFKNSTKMKRLAKGLAKKHEKLVKKGDLENSKALSVLILEVDLIAKKFESVENEFKLSKGKEAKTKAKEKYADLEKEFKKLVVIAKKDSTKKALIAVGGLALVVGVLAAGLFGLNSLYNSGVIDNAGTNIQMRAEKVFMNKEADAALKGANSTDALKNMATRGGLNIMYSGIIKATNNDLVKTATLAGATAGGVLSIGVLNKLRNMGRKDKTIAATVKAIEELKMAERKTEESKTSEGDSQ